MGKKSRKQQQLAETKLKLCPALTDKGVIRLVDSLLDRTSKFSPGVMTSPSAAVWEEYDAITGLVRAIEQRQGPTPRPLPPREEAMAEFVTWLHQSNAKFDKVEIAQFSDVGWGLKVHEEIKREEKVIEVPSRLFFSKESVMSDDMAVLVKGEPILSAMPNLVLALLLLNERYSPTSFWKPYINILPQFVNLPLYFSKEDLLELEGSPVLIECISQVRNISRLYAILHKQLRAYSNFSLPLCSVGFNYTDFVWAVSCVMSRQNKVPLSLSGSSSPSNSESLVLIPLWDMANHAPGKILSDFDTDTRSCVSYSMSDLSPGDEFRIFYGPRGNGELILNQGFAVERNPFDIVKVWIGLSSSKDEQLRKLLNKLHLATSGHFMVGFGSSPFSLDLIVFVRLITATEDQLKRWEDDQHLKEVARKAWVQGDQKVLEFLEKRCQLFMMPYKTTIEHDVRLLATEQVTGRTKNSVMLRLSEKIILKNASEIAFAIRRKLDEGEEIEWEGQSKSKQQEEEEKTTNNDKKVTKLSTEENNDSISQVESQSTEEGKESSSSGGKLSQETKVLTNNGLQEDNDDSV